MYILNLHLAGAIGWKEYPTLKLMMEMVMTQSYTMPPETIPTDDIKVRVARACVYNSNHFKYEYGKNSLSFKKN